MATDSTIEVYEERKLTRSGGVLQKNEISLVDLADTLRAAKFWIAGVTLVAAVATAIAVYFIPDSYKADASLLPPQQGQSTLASLAGAAVGGLAANALGSSLSLKNPGDIYVGVLKSRTIADDIIAQFHLRDVSHHQTLAAARRQLAKHTNITTEKEGLIKVSVDDHDPKRAADIANAYVDELYKQNARLAITESSQRRVFFEQQLRAEKDLLADAEVALKQNQESSGLIVPEGQAEALIKASAELQAEIATREVELQSLRSYATDANPQVAVLQREIAALKEQAQRVQGRGGTGGLMDISGGKLPQASLGYIRKLRDVKYHETLFELLAKQYEAARMDEAKSAPVLQVVDRAVLPDQKSWPPRALLTLGAALAAMVLASLFVIVRNSWNPIR